MPPPLPQSHSMAQLIEAILLSPVTGRAVAWALCDTATERRARATVADFAARRGAKAAMATALEGNASDAISANSALSG